MYPPVRRASIRSISHRLTQARRIMARKSAVKAAGPAKATRKAGRRKSVPAAKQRKTARPAPAAKKAARRPGRRAVRRPEGLFGKVAGAESRNIGHVQLDVGRAGNARVKRLIYPVGFRWSKDMKPAIGGDFCQHAHVGFLAHGEIHIEYPDGCIIEHRAPHVICIEPGHDGWVVGKEPVVMIEIDFEGDTVAKLGMPAAHSH